ncbi:hypothetical protein D030_3379A, partial [Vibrio parahaemolyticus AQ3810]
MRTKV